MKCKAWKSMLILLLTVGFLAGCQDNTVPAHSGNYTYGTVHGVTWSVANRFEDPEQIELYFAETGNTLQSRYCSYDYQALGALAEGDLLPTLFEVTTPLAEMLAQNGWCRDIRPQVEAAGISLAEFDPAILDFFTDESGRLCGLPIDYRVTSILCNGQVFQEAGLVNPDGSPQLPSTWDELVAACKTIHDQTGKYGFAMSAQDPESAMFFVALAMNYGADLITKDEHGALSAHLDTPETVAAMEGYRALALSDGMTGDTSLNNRNFCLNQMCAGTAAMCFGTSNEPGWLTVQDMALIDPGLLYEIPIPAGPEGIRNTLAQGNGFWFAASATDEQVTAALEFLLRQGFWAQEATPALVESWEADWAAMLKQNMIILPDFPAYTATVREIQLKKIKEYQSNFNFDAQFSGFYQSVYQNGNVILEESQSIVIYRELISVVQEVLNNPQTADVPALLAQAQTNAQSFLNT